MKSAREYNLIVYSLDKTEPDPSTLFSNLSKLTEILYRNHEMRLQMPYQDIKALSRHKVRNLGVRGTHVKSLGLEKTDHSPPLQSNSPPSQGGLLESQEQNEVVNNKDGGGGSTWKPSRCAWACKGTSAQCKHKDILGKWVSVKSGRSSTTKRSVLPRASEEKKVCMGVRDGMRKKEQKKRWNRTGRIDRSPALKLYLWRTLKDV